MIHVADIPGARCSVGIDGDTWVVAKGEQRFLATEAILPFVACLEVSYQALLASLRSGLNHQGLPESLADNFPYVDIVAEVLLRGSDKWVSLAAHWLDHLPPTTHLSDAVRSALSKRRGTQKSRQQLQRWLSLHGIDVRS